MRAGEAPSANRKGVHLKTESANHQQAVYF